MYFISSVSRRHAYLLDPTLRKTFRATLSRNLEAVPGDLVSPINISEDGLIKSIEKRRNLIKRAYRNKTKLLASNLDLFCIITAPNQLFQTDFIDRAHTVAQEQCIPCLLICNKSDLNEFADFYYRAKSIYSSVIRAIYPTSCKNSDGIERVLKKLTSSNSHKHSAFVGVSGVGKSSLIKELTGCETHTGELSEKSGKGKQTTTRAQTWQLKNTTWPMLTDLPGIQKFGISHLDRTKLELGFPEFKTHAIQCKFSPCTHKDEPECQIRAAVKNSLIPKSRYASWISVLKERETWERKNPSSFV